MWFAVMRLARDHVKADKNGHSAMVTVENFTATHAREVVQPLLPPLGRHSFEPMEGDLKLMQEDMLRHSVHHIGLSLGFSELAALLPHQASLIEVDPLKWMGAPDDMGHSIIHSIVATCCVMGCFSGCWLKGKSYDSCRMRCTTLSERFVVYFSLPL